MTKDNSKQLLIGGLLVLAGIVFLVQQIFHLPSAACLYRCSLRRVESYSFIWS